MAHWIDDLAKTLARPTRFGGLRAAPQCRTERGFALVRDRDELALLSGPCGLRQTDQELVTSFATQRSSNGGGLLSYSTTTVRDRDTGTVRATTAIRRGDSSILDLATTHGPHRPAALQAFFGLGFTGQHELQVWIDDGRLSGMLDGRPWEAVALSQASAKGSGDGEPPLALRFRDGGVMPELRVDPAVVEELTAIANQAMRELPSCIQYPESFSVRSGSGFAGCDDCKSECDKKQNWCLAEVPAKAAACGPFFGVCLAAYGADCLSDASNCDNACINPPGPCCPRRCEQGGYAECCTADATCCGSRCCPAGSHCADPAHSLCCGPDSGPPCRDVCCPQGMRCANSTYGFCCPRDAGDYCPKVWDDEHWTPDCCPPGEVCADSATGLCCPRDHGPICGDRCCAPGEICREGQCCDPRLLCGRGERATCCQGECRDGECCSSPSHMCGDVCCPPFNPCCEIDGRPVCCGANEFCTPERCCALERICGRRCCPPKNYCDDPGTETCIRCDGNLEPCMTLDADGSPRGICCPPNVSCCAGRCCEPGEACCAPGAVPGCYPSYACLH